MKSKFYNLLWAALAVMLFAGCTNIASNDAAITGGMILPGQCLVSVGVGETINEAGARTINPTTVYDNTSVFQKLLSVEAGRYLRLVEQRFILRQRA